jgi:2-dehydropantoate 2-reductase
MKVCIVGCGAVGSLFAANLAQLEDVASGRPTEVDSITGALVREAGRHGVKAPLHTAMWALVGGREASYS